MPRDLSISLLAQGVTLLGLEEETPVSGETCLAEAGSLGVKMLTALTAAKHAQQTNGTLITDETPMCIETTFGELLSFVAVSLAFNHKLLDAVIEAHTARL